jgi:hypothetical protein
MAIKYICILTGALLVLAIPSGLPYNYYIFLRWVVFLASIFLIYGFYKSKLNAWVFIFSVVAFLFNPISPIFMNKSSWVSIDLITAILFFLSAFSVRKHT